MRGEDNLVVVTTDAASRGLDLRDITHVIMFDFAKTAVDFLHRCGRTARAGRSGRVTAFYLSSPLEGGQPVESQRALAEIIQEKIRTGEPLEKAFSRKRSFR